jgi:hypothetical protein
MTRLFADFATFVAYCGYVVYLYGFPLPKVTATYQAETSRLVCESQ